MYLTETGILRDKGQKEGEGEGEREEMVRRKKREMRGKKRMEEGGEKRENIKIFPTLGRIKGE